MTTWVIISWVGVAIFTGVNIFVFLKLKKASQEMLKMAFPNAKNMNDAIAQMQNLANTSKRGKKRKLGGFRPGSTAAGPGPGKVDPKLRSAMEMLDKLRRQ